MEPLPKLALVITPVYDHIAHCQILVNKILMK